MLYLNDGGAHIGDEASHGAMRRQVLPRDRSGGPLARGGKHKGNGADLSAGRKLFETTLAW